MRVFIKLSKTFGWTPDYLLNELSLDDVFLWYNELAEMEQEEIDALKGRPQMGFDDFRKQMKEHGLYKQK